MTNKATTITSILVANRGEIACRVMRTAKEMGIRTIAVYSEADAKAPHVQDADEAVLIGPAPASDSYLNIEKIIDAALSTGAHAIHPGYGFLSENALFARACEDAGIIFIGPGVDAIEIMGDKAKAKSRMIKAGVPCIPGYQDSDQSDTVLCAAGKEIGFPIMIKAAAGGGGRGMRLVEKEVDLKAALKTARSEAENAFGSGTLILERAIIAPRHIEIQVLADTHGNVIHLGERDCSVQRRHQKVLEEAPSPVVGTDLRDAMGAAAVKAAGDIGYVGAGTVEFLLADDGTFYFLEMNTRLQVEHPVTEMITGLDLVAQQIQVAQGKTLNVSQEDIVFSGHAIEARLYAEDVTQGFLPAAGHIDFWRPASMARTDAGIATGLNVSAFYDPMLAKIITHGATREEARRKLISALENTALFGPTTNKSFLIAALEKSAFATGAATTGFIDQNFAQGELVAPSFTAEIAACAGVLLFCADRQTAHAKSLDIPDALLNWRSAFSLPTPYLLEVGEAQHVVGVTPVGAHEYIVQIGDGSISVKVDQRTDHDAVLTVDGKRKTILFNIPANSTGQIQLSHTGSDFDVQNLNALFARQDDGADAGTIIAPMHGLLVNVDVSVDQTIEIGDRLAVLEAMKMQHELTASVSGTIKAVHHKAGDQVSAKSMLIEIEPDSA